MSGAYCIGSCGGTFHFVFVMFVVFSPNFFKENTLNHLKELIGRIGLQDFELLLALPEAGK